MRDLYLGFRFSHQLVLEAQCGLRAASLHSVPKPRKGLTIVWKGVKLGVWLGRHTFETIANVSKVQLRPDGNVSWRIRSKVVLTTRSSVSRCHESAA